MLLLSASVSANPEMTRQVDSCGWEHTYTAPFYKRHLSVLDLSTSIRTPETSKLLMSSWRSALGSGEELNILTGD